MKNQLMQASASWCIRDLKGACKAQTKNITTHWFECARLLKLDRMEFLTRNAETDITFHLPSAGTWGNV